MFGYDNVHSLSVTIGDPGADKDICLFRAPGKVEILRAYAVDNIGVAAADGTGFSLALYNGGTSGTALTAVAGTIGGTTATWTATVAKAFTITEGTLSEGQYLWARYDETGTVAQHIIVMFDYVVGVGA